MFTGAIYVLQSIDFAQPFYPCLHKNYCYLMIKLHHLVLAMQNMYGKAAEFWAELRLELLSAGELSGEEKGTSNQIWRLYWASHQVLLPCIFSRN
jgi:hypothetical protein